MAKEHFKGTYNGIQFDYQKNESSDTGTLTTILKNGVMSTHVLKNWGVTRIMQFIESMVNLA